MADNLLTVTALNLEEDIKMNKLLIAVSLLSISATSFAGQWKDHMKESLKSDFYLSVIYQYRNTPEYQEFKDLYNVRKQSTKPYLKNLAQENHPLGLFAMSQFWHSKGNFNKYAKAMEKLYVVADEEGKYKILSELAAFYEGQDSRPKLGYLALMSQLYDIESHPYYGPMLEEAIATHGHNKLQKASEKVNARLAENEKVASHLSFDYTPEYWRDVKQGESDAYVENSN